MGHVMRESMAYGLIVYFVDSPQSVLLQFVLKALLTADQRKVMPMPRYSP